MRTILPTKTTAELNEVVLSYHRLRGLHLLAVVFAATILILIGIHVVRLPMILGAINKR